MDCCAGTGVTPPGRRVPPGRGKRFLEPGLHQGSVLQNCTFQDGEL